MLRCSEIIQREQTTRGKKSALKSIISLGTNGNLVSNGSSLNLTYSKTGDVSHMKVPYAGNFKQSPPQFDLANNLNGDDCNLKDVS